MKRYTKSQGVLQCESPLNAVYKAAHFQLRLFVSYVVIVVVHYHPLDIYIYILVWIINIIATICSKYFCFLNWIMWKMFHYRTITYHFVFMQIFFDRPIPNVEHYLFPLTPFSTSHEIVSILISILMIVLPIFLLETYQTNNFGILSDSCCILPTSIHIFTQSVHYSSRNRFPDYLAHYSHFYSPNLQFVTLLWRLESVGKNESQCDSIVRIGDVATLCRSYHYSITS